MESPREAIPHSDAFAAAATALDEAIADLRAFSEKYVVLYGRPVPRSLIEREYRQSAQEQFLDILQGMLSVNDFCIERPKTRPAPSIYETPYSITRPIHLFGFNIANRQVGSVLLTCQNGNHKHICLQEILSDRIEFEVRNKKEQRELEEAYQTMVGLYPIL